MWSNDYPHGNSTWPDSKKFIDRDLGHLPADIRKKLVYTNVKSLYDIDIPHPVPVGARFGRVTRLARWRTRQSLTARHFLGYYRGRYSYTTKDNEVHEGLISTDPNPSCPPRASWLNTVLEVLCPHATVPIWSSIC